MNFEMLLERFAQAIGSGRTQDLAALFTEDGCYDDGFFGPHTGREAIASMIGRWYKGGENFHWTFLEPVSSGPLGYAHYCFTYLSLEPESAGQLIVSEGTAKFHLRDGLIFRYTETGDRGIVFSQLGYQSERVQKLLARFAKIQCTTQYATQNIASRAG